MAIFHWNGFGCGPAYPVSTSWEFHYPKHWRSEGHQEQPGNISREMRQGTCKKHVFAEKLHIFMLEIHQLWLCAKKTVVVEKKEI